MKAETEEMKESTLDSQTNQRLIELWDTALPNVSYLEEDEIACYLLNASPPKQSDQKAGGPCTEDNILKKIDCNPAAA